MEVEVVKTSRFFGSTIRAKRCLFPSYENGGIEESVALEASALSFCTLSRIVPDFLG